MFPSRISQRVNESAQEAKNQQKPNNFSEKKKILNNPEWNEAQYQYIGTERSRN